jgi:AcrR family transcriptional regulator
MPTSHETQPEAQPNGRSQLIDSAIRAVAAHGRKGATVRIIADDASVTPGLIMHHFDTKARLLEEADHVVANRFKEAMTTPADNLSADETIKAIAGQLSILIGSEPELRAYVRRSLLEATPSGAAIFDQLVDVTVKQVHKYLPEQTATDQDLRWTAAQVVAINLAGLIFEPFLDKWTEQPPFSADDVARRTNANARFIQAGVTDALSK